MIDAGRQNPFSCKDCVERTLGCHDRCEKYLEGKKKYAELRNSIEGDHDIQAYIRTSIKRRSHIEKKQKFLRRPKSK